MYKLVNVFVDSDAHGTFGFRAIVTQSAGCCYEGMEARNVLFGMFYLQPRHGVVEMACSD